MKRIDEKTLNTILAKLTTEEKRFLNDIIDDSLAYLPIYIDCSEQDDDLENQNILLSKLFETKNTTELSDFQKALRVFIQSKDCGDLLDPPIVGWERVEREKYNLLSYAEKQDKKKTYFNQYFTRKDKIERDVLSFKKSWTAKVSA